MIRKQPAASAMATRSRWRFPTSLRIPCAVFSIFTGLTLTYWMVLESTLRENERLDFSELTHQIAVHITSRLRDDEQILRGAIGLFNVLPEVTRDQWRRYVTGLRLGENYPGIQGVGFSQWVNPDELAAHIDRVRAEGFPDYTIRPPGDRPVYTSIIYLEPFNAMNQRAFGFDMYSEPVRREAMERALETNNTAMSSSVVLVQETEQDQQHGSLLYLPVYRPGASLDTGAKRRAAIMGFVYSPLRIKDLVYGALPTIPSAFSFEVYSNDDFRADALVFDSPGDSTTAQPTGGRPMLESRETLNLFGSRWTIVFHGFAPVVTGIGHTAAHAVLTGGLLFSAALFSLTFSLMRRRDLALAMAKTRSESEARFRSYFNLPLVGAALSSPSKQWLAVNDRLCSNLGYSREELLAGTWDQMTHPQDLAVQLELFDRVLAGETNGYALEKRFTRKNGTFLWASLAVQCVRNEEGQIEYFASLIEDITHRKREERVSSARIKLADYSLNRQFHDVIAKSLDILRELTGSELGCFFFAAPGSAVLTMQAWSTKTEHGRANDWEGRLYDIGQTGAFADCVRQGRVVINNDHGIRPDNNYLASGQAEPVRQLAAPVLRSGHPVAVIMIGKKNTDYDADDAATAAAFADISWNIAEQVMAKQELLESDQRFQVAFERAPVGITLTDFDDGTLLDVNDCWLANCGFSREEALGHTSVELGAISAEEGDHLTMLLKRDGRVDGREILARSKDGSQLTVMYSGNRITVQGKRRLLSITQNITALRTLQRQVEQSHRLESLGQLAGGVAHEFNNMLAVILGSTDMLRDKLGSKPGALHEELEAIRMSATRSAEITRQLLVLARREDVHPQIINLNETVTELSIVLRRLIGENIEFQWNPSCEPCHVRADSTQITQILTNLCVNSRDAIKGDGRITVDTANVTLDAAFCTANEETEPGKYVLLTVRDSGSGIQPNALTHIFEPFFTTKGVGHGTGLGLAMVYGIVRQNGGTVLVENQPGSGACFRIYLPAVPAKAADRVDADRKPTTEIPRGNGETVLVVEDEPSVLRLCEQFLRRLGYRVLSAASPEEAIRLAALHAGEIGLLLSDVRMPGKSGPDLLLLLRQSIPELRVIFMSGYAPTSIDRHGLADDADFLEKPFDFRTLATRVFAALH